MQSLTVGFRMFTYIYQGRIFRHSEDFSVMNGVWKQKSKLPPEPAYSYLLRFPLWGSSILYVRTVSGSDDIPAHYFKLVNLAVSERAFNTTPWAALNRLMLHKTGAFFVFVQIKLFFSPNKNSFCVRTKEPIYPARPLYANIRISHTPYPLPCVRTK